MKRKFKVIEKKPGLSGKNNRLKKDRLILKIFIFLFSSLIPLYAQYKLENAFPNLSFSSPVDFQSPDDGTNRIFIVEQAGFIKVFENTDSVSGAKIFLNISSKVAYGGEMGLLGLAFHPDFKNNGYFYLDYTKDNPRETIISRFKVLDSNKDSADENSELILLRIFQPYPNHNGGQIVFGPDGMLYIALGDGGSGGDPQNRAQNRDSLLGKILRINVDSASPPLNYSIPADNPYKNNNLGFREEIFAYGLRNPWRFSFDPVTSQLWCADVGQDKWEEIDIIEKGKNYGWRCYEGDHDYNLSGCSDTGYVFPVWEYPHSVGRSITGGYVYRGDSIPELFGRYIYADFETRKVWAFNYMSMAPFPNELLLAAPGGVSSFGVDQNGELYLCCFDGNIYKLKKAPTGLSDIKEQDFNYALLQNYPNPFNPSTTIIYKVPEKSRIELRAVNILGNEVSKLLNKIVAPGAYEEIWDASYLPSGVYFIIMNGESMRSGRTFVKTVKIMLLK